MKNTFFATLLAFIALSLTVLLGSCNKENPPLPLSPEVINLIQPDSSTIFARAGDVINLELFLATEKAIDSIRGGYFIDTAQINSNITYSYTDTTFFSMVFPDSSNTQSYSGTLTIPDSVTGVRLFRPYFPQQETPFFPAQYDAVRVMLEMTAGGQIFEKQLKIIIE